MPYPEIRHCLVCEGVRPEAYNKLNILGFFGVAPDVNISVFEFEKPFQVAFVFLGGAGDAIAKIAFQIAHESGELILSTPPLDSPRGPENRRLVAAVAFNLVFPRAGKYLIRFLVEGRKHFESSFELTQGNPKDFQIQA